MNLTTMRANVRIDMHDEDSSNYRWTDATLNRHVARAVEEYQRAWPLVGNYTASATASRWYDLTAQAGYLWCERVEYPVDENPPLYIAFREPYRGNVLITERMAPVVGENIKFWYAREHTLDSSNSTLPPEHEEMIATGAAAYAALEWASYAVGRINPSGFTPLHYRELGMAWLREFQAHLERLRLLRSVEADLMVHWGAVPSQWQVV